MTDRRTIQELCAENPATIPLWKRSFDVALSSVGLVVSLPLTLLLALLVKLTSPGPVFFSQERYGLNGKLFRILKFRKMADTVRGGDRVTSRHDFRMTGLGRVLERTKLDELPQLINIWKGEMSFVGPRPEDPAFADLHPEAFAVILSTPPGVAGPNQILYRNESELYPPDCKDRGTYYADHILGLKIPVDVNYARNRTLLRDLMILFGTIGVTVWGVLPLATLRRNPILVAHLAAFPVIAGVSLAATFALGDPAVPFWRHAGFGVMLVAFTALQTLLFFLFRVHTIIPRYLGVRDVGAIVKAALGATAVGILAAPLFGDPARILAAMLPYACFSIVLTLLWLHLLRQLGERSRRDTKTPLEIGAAGVFGLASVAAWLAAGWMVSGPGDSAPAMTVDLAFGLLASNAAVFYALGGPGLLLRPGSIRDQFAIVGIAAVAGMALHFGRYLLVGERLPGEAFMTAELLAGTTLVVALQWAASSGVSLRRRSGRMLLVGTLREVDDYFTRSPIQEAGRAAGVVLVGQFRQGMTIHALPILGELSEARIIREQLNFEHIVALAQEHRRALAELGIEAELHARSGDVG